MWSIHALQQDILLTWRRHFEKDSCTLLVHSATDSPSLAWRANTSRKHSAKWSCFSLSGNLSSSNVQILSSPSSAVSCSMVMCSTVSSANPSKSVNTQGPRCFLSKSFREAILAWHQSFSSAPCHPELRQKTLELPGGTIGFRFHGAASYALVRLNMRAPSLGLRYQFKRINWFPTPIGKGRQPCAQRKPACCFFLLERVSRLQHSIHADVTSDPMGWHCFLIFL